jgi:hypothetical protein
MLVDRPIVEIFFMSGRASYTHAVPDFDEKSTAVHLFSDMDTAVTASNVSVFGMACGWTADMPGPVKAGL